MSEKLDLPGIGDRIRALREAAGLTQADLARIVGGHGSKVSAWESGQRLPETEALYRMAGRFGVAVDYILTGLHRAPAFVADALRTLLNELDGDNENALHLEPVEGEELRDDAGDQPLTASRRSGAGRRRSP